MLVAQGDLVGLGDVVGLDGSESHAQALASLPQQLEGVGGGALRGGALRISPVFLDEVGLQGCGDFVGRLQRVVDGPVPCSVVNHGASIAPLRAFRTPGISSASSRPGEAIVGFVAVVLATAIAYLGIRLTAWTQWILIAIEYTGVGILAIWCLVAVFSHNPHSVPFSWSWF